MNLGFMVHVTSSLALPRPLITDKICFLDVIRIYQAKVLADKYSMYELTVMRAKERTSKSFEDQVLARSVFLTFILIASC